MRSESSLTTKELTRLTGLKRETLRFYERRSLISAPGRTPGGYRLFPPETVERLRFIREAKQLGFSLAEIVELLSLDSSGARACDTVAAEAQVKLVEVESRLRSLLEIKVKLKQTIARCEARRPGACCDAACLAGVN